MTVATSQAAILVSWGLAETDTSVKPTGFDDSILSGNSNFTNNGATYNGTNSNTAAYYGGFDSANKSAIFSVASTATTAFQVQNNANYDRIRVVDSGAAAGFTETMIVWEAANWLNGIGGDNLLGLTMDGFKSGGSGENQRSFIIQSAGTWYSSEVENWDGINDLTIADATLATWYDFTAMNSETVGASFAATSNVGGVTGDTIDFNAITAVGLYHVGNSVGGASGLQIGHFEITSVPEPSAALLGSLGLLAFFRRRR